MIISKRMALLEKAAEPAPASEGHATSKEWLERLEQMGRDGYFDGEPDFSRALAEFRTASAKVRGSINPPWDLPKYHVYEYTKRGRLAILWDNLRDEAVEAAARWLANMTKRVFKGLPPISVAEYRALTGWFVANRERILAWAGGADYKRFDLGNGRSRRVFDFDWMIKRDGYGGVRKGTGEVFDDLRRLKALFEGGAAAKLIRMS
jgi:hypothetical protein